MVCGYGRFNHFILFVVRPSDIHYAGPLLFQWIGHAAFIVGEDPRGVKTGCGIIVEDLGALSRIVRGRNEARQRALEQRLRRIMTRWDAESLLESANGHFHNYIEWTPITLRGEKKRTPP